MINNNSESKRMAKILELYNALGEIIWYTKEISNPIYNINSNGKREARDLFEIRAGFAKAYNEYYDRGIRIETTQLNDALDQIKEE